MNVALLPAHKTKIVATIGPASESPEMLVRLIRAGVNVARLNFSHGNPSKHAEVIRRVRDATRETGRRVAIMADLPGPKLRLGKIDPEPIQFLPGAHFTLTSEDIVGDTQRASTSFERLPRVVKPGDRIFLNDGLVQLVVERVAGNEVECTVAVGGELRSRKGLNLPGVDLGISAFTEHERLAHGVDTCDRACLEFALDMASLVEHALYTVPSDLLVVPTRGGTVARAISCFKPPVWIIAPSSDPAVCQNLAFSYGVYPVDLAEQPDDWREWTSRWVRENGIAAERVMLVAGPSPRNPKANYRIELMRLDAESMLQ